MRASIFLLAILLAVVACTPIIKPVAVSPTATATATVTPTKTQVTPSPAPLTAQVTADSLHVRAEPMGFVLGYLYHGDPVTLTGACSDDPKGWAEIVWQDGTAWVRASFLSENKCQKVTGD